MASQWCDIINMYTIDNDKGLFSYIAHLPIDNNPENTRRASTIASVRNLATYNAKRIGVYILHYIYIINL